MIAPQFGDPAADAAVEDLADAIILGGIVLAVVLMLLTLFRMLNANLGSRDPAAYYRATLRLYIGSIALAFGGLMLALLI